MQAEEDESMKAKPTSRLSKEAAAKKGSYEEVSCAKCIYSQTLKTVRLMVRLEPISELAAAESGL